MSNSPLFDHLHDERPVFTPEGLLDAVVGLRQLPSREVPPVCVLEFDGDLYDRLARSGKGRPHATWACFHTPMLTVETELGPCGVVPRTIGGPFATLVAEQLAASGARFVLGLTSAGRVGPKRRLPHFVVADAALRDEGTSLHYLPASRTVESDAALNDFLVRELASLPLTTYRGLVWTTDAPYRETSSMLRARGDEGAVAVEMQAASLFAFAKARGTVKTGVVAYVSNAVDAEGEPFDKGPENVEEALLFAMCRAAYRFDTARAT